MSAFIDTHCHLDAFPSITQVLEEAPSTEVIAVTELPSRYQLLRTQLRREQGVHVALGLHPLTAARAGSFELGMLIRLLPTTDYVGEIGLDFSSHGKQTV